MYGDISQTYGFNGTNLTVTVDLMANPPVTTNFNWEMNGKNISNSSGIVLLPASISFMPLRVENTGSYLVRGCNNLTCTVSQNFTFDVYCELWVWLVRAGMGVVVKREVL